MTKKAPQKNGEFVFGVHPILELLKAKRRKMITIYTTNPLPDAWQQVEQLMPKYPVQKQYVDREVLTKLAGTPDHQNMVALVNPFVYRKKFFDPARESFLVMIDGVQDPRNLGAIIRSAYCTGVHGIIIVKKGGAPLNGVAIKSSAGLAEHMEIYIASSARQAAQELKTAGYAMYMATFDGEKATECSYKNELCLVIGGEGFGISKDILSLGTHITIPQRTTDISYNASVAAGILLFVIANKNKTI